MQEIKRSRYLSKHIIVIGPTRTGTTALFRFLGQEPRIQISTKKETNYFYQHYPDGSPSRQEYLGNFANPNSSPFCLEASPCYFMAGRTLAQAAKDTLGDVKVIVTLREPVERYLSLCRHIVTKRNLGTQLDLDQFTEQCINFNRSLFQGLEDVNHMSFIEGCYKELLDEWIDVMGPDNIHVTFYESLFRAETQKAALGELMSWLGIPDSKLIDKPISLENISRAQPKSERLQKLALQLNDRLEPALNRYGSIRSLVRSIYYSLNTGKADDLSIPGRQVISHLGNAYADRNKGLEQTLERIGFHQMPDWTGSMPANSTEQRD